MLDATPTRSLTLVTCYPFYHVGPAPQRNIVCAVRADTAAPVSVAVEQVSGRRAGSKCRNMLYEEIKGSRQKTECGLSGKSETDEEQEAV